jgi:hypothetical protein
MVDFLVPTSLDQLIFILKIILTSFTKQAALMRSTVLSLPPLYSLPQASPNNLTPHWTKAEMNITVKHSLIMLEIKKASYRFQLIPLISLNFSLSSMEKIRGVIYSI